MARPDAREALLAELLGDFKVLLDRVDAVTPNLTQARNDLDFTANRLLGSIEPFRTRLVTSAVEQINRDTRLIAARTVEEQTAAMKMAARAVFDEQLNPTVDKLGRDLQAAIKQIHRPWERWLSHTCTALVAAWAALIAASFYVSR